MNYLFTPTQALDAIMARIKGEFDNEQLMKLGPLMVCSTDDILRICEETELNTSEYTSGYLQGQADMLKAEKLEHERAGCRWSSTKRGLA